MSKDLSDTANRKRLKKSSFALARVAQHGSTAEQKKVRAAVEKKYPSLKKDD